MKREQKLLRELNLMDRFLFAEAMEDQFFAETILEIILGKEIALQYSPQTEKELRKSAKKRSVRLDVWMRDQDDVVYDTEVQQKDTKNLPKRSRYYQAMMDSKLLEPGETDFNQLSPVCVIMICPFDIGGKGYYRYTYRMRCDEDTSLSLDDGAFRMFLNTKGQYPETESRELVELLYYMEHTTTEVSERSGKRIQDLHRRIEKLRENEEVAMRYLRELEERMAAKKEAREEGLAEGRAEGELRLLIRMICKKMEKGKTISEIAEDLEETLETVQKITDVAENVLPKHDVDAIFETMKTQNR